VDLTDPAALLRRCFASLAAIGIVATAVELALSRHWNSAVQLIPWFALGLLAAALALLLVGPGRRSLRAVRLLAVIVLVTAGLGIFEHVLANYRAGPLDFRYESRWATMSAVSRWWAAATESVGPSPTLAPGVLAQAAACLMSATLRHPALRPAGTPAATGSAAELQRTR